MSWFWFALISAVCFAIFSVLVRLTLKDQGDAQAFAPIANAIVGILLLGIAWFEETFFHPQFWDYILLIISSMALAGASYLIIWARQITPVSQISLVQQLAMVWTFIGGIWLLSETLNGLKVLSMFLIPSLSTPSEIIGLMDTDKIALCNKFNGLRHRLLNVGDCSRQWHCLSPWLPSGDKQRGYPRFSRHILYHNQGAHQQDPRGAYDISCALQWYCASGGSRPHYNRTSR